MDALVEWLKATWLSGAINQTPWVWPAAETIHFIGLSLLLGCAGFFDLRLMGFFRAVPLAAAAQLIPVAATGFVLNLVTGLIFLIALPDQYAYNVAWWMKVGCLGVAGLNALVFNQVVSRGIIDPAAEAVMPPIAKAIGAVSLIAWLGVLYFGRMLPALGDAF